MKMVILSGILLCVLLGNVLGTDYRNCGSLFHIKSVQLDDCAKEDCVIRVNKNISLTVEALTDSRVDNLTAQLYVVYFGHKFDLTMVPSDPCKSVKCPLHENSSFKYDATFSAGSNYAWHEPVDMTLRVTDGKSNSRPFLCVQVSVSLEDPLLDNRSL